MAEIISDKPARIIKLNPTPEGASEPEVVQAITLDKPVLVALGGLDATSVNQSRNFAESRFEELLGEGLFNDAFQSYALVYDDPFFAPANHKSLIADYYEKGEQAEASQVARAIAKQWIDQNLRPVIEDISPLSGQSREDTLLKTEQMLGNLNFFAFSFGSVLLRHIHQETQSLLQEKGFNSLESKRVMQRVKALTIGDLAHWKYKVSDWHFNSVHLTSHNDELVKPMIAGHEQNFATEPVRFEKPADSMLVIHAALSKEGFEVIERKAGKDPVLKDRVDPTGHSAGLHTRQRFTEHGGSLFVTTMLQSVLRNMLAASVAGREINSPEELMSPADVRQDQLGYLGHAPKYGYADRLRPLLDSSTGSERTPRR